MVNKFKHLVREAKDENAIPKIVTIPHTRWLELPESEQVYTDEALAHVLRILRGAAKRERSGRFSPSSLGECQRRVLFGYAGVDKLGEDPDSMDLMGLGSWGHLRWQAEGLTAGWMTKAEIWVKHATLPMGGTLDGILHDGSIFELKTLHDFVFTKQVDQLDEAKHNHLLQVTAYMIMTKRTKASLIYESRSTGQYHEFRMAYDPVLGKEVKEMIEELMDHVQDDTLPPMLDGCSRRSGDVYRRCPYRRHCPKAVRVSQ